VNVVVVVVIIYLDIGIFPPKGFYSVCVVLDSCLSYESALAVFIPPSQRNVRLYARTKQDVK